MGFLDKIKETLRDKARDRVYARLCAIGVDARIAERGRPEEKLGCIGLKRSLGLVEICGEPIRWVNVINWTQHFPGNVQKYRNVYLVHDPYLSTKSKLNGNEIGQRIKKDVLLNQGLIGLNRDIEILAFPEDKCWAILSKDYEGRNPPPSSEEWNSFKTIARHLLESSGE